MKNTLNERNRTVKTIRNYIVSTRIFFFSRRVRNPKRRRKNKLGGKIYVKQVVFKDMGEGLKYE